jgi:hypothetical protein
MSHRNIFNKVHHPLVEEEEKEEEKEKEEESTPLPKEEEEKEEEKEKEEESTPLPKEEKEKETPPTVVTEQELPKKLAILVTEIVPLKTSPPKLRRSERIREKTIDKSFENLLKIRARKTIKK